MKRVAITGAFSYTGRYLAKLLLDAGHSVVSLSRRTAPLAPAPLSPAEVQRVLARPLDFGDEAALGKTLEGCDVLFCTYWIRFAKGDDTHDAAAARVARLFDVARRAGVRRVVFTSHTRVTEDSPFPYLAGKAKACAALRAAGLPSYGIARPCGIFGDTPGESILMNNAAWVLRKVPLFILPGDGSPRFQPIHVRDFAELLFDMGGFGAAGDGHEAQEHDACGPDAPTSLQLFSHLARVAESKAIIAAPGLSTRMITAMTKPINWYTGDILLDADDLDLLCAGLTVADNPDDPAIQRRRSLLAWLDEVGPQLGREYISSVKRYYAVKTG